MVTHPVSDVWKAFLAWCQEEITDREKELAPLKDGSQHVGKKYQGEWVDITKERISQIEREIASLENTMHRVKTEYAPRT